jgi:hypothetical protein
VRPGDLTRIKKTLLILFIFRRFIPKRVDFEAIIYIEGELFSYKRGKFNPTISVTLAVITNDKNP